MITQYLNQSDPISLEALPPGTDHDYSTYEGQAKTLLDWFDLVDQSAGLPARVQSDAYRHACQGLGVNPDTQGAMVALEGFWDTIKANMSSFGTMAQLDDSNMDDIKALFTAYQQAAETIESDPTSKAITSEWLKIRLMDSKGDVSIDNVMAIMKNYQDTMAFADAFSRNVMALVKTTEEYATLNMKTRKEQSSQFASKVTAILRNMIKDTKLPNKRVDGDYVNLFSNPLESGHVLQVSHIDPKLLDQGDYKKVYEITWEKPKGRKAADEDVPVLTKKQMLELINTMKSSFRRRLTMAQNHAVEEALRRLFQIDLSKAEGLSAEERKNLVKMVHSMVNNFYNGWGEVGRHYQMYHVTLLRWIRVSLKAY